MRSLICSPFLKFAFCIQLFVLLQAPELRAQSYEIAIANNWYNIKYPDDMAWEKESCWKNLSLFRFALMRPIFKITNTSSNGKSISRLRLRLKASSPYTFDKVSEFDVNYGGSSQPQIFANILSPDTIDDGIKSQTIDISFATRPVRPGESYGIYATLVRKDGVFELFNYQDVLWDSTGNNRNDNTMVQVTYTDGTVLPEVPLFEYRRTSATYDGYTDGTSGKAIVWYCGALSPGYDFKGRIFMSKYGIESYMGTYYFKQTLPKPKPTPTPTKTPTPYPTPIEPKSFSPVVPQAKCIKEVDKDTAIAVFGYNNLNSSSVTINPGITPGNVNSVNNALSILSQQPVVFAPGTNPYAMQVTFNKNSQVSWVLEYQQTGRQTATADANTPLCNSNLPPVCQIASESGKITSGCQGPLTSLELDGSASYDPDNTSLTHVWTTDCPAQIADPSAAKTSISFEESAIASGLQCTVTLAINDRLSTTDCSVSVALTPCAPDCSETDIRTSQIGFDSAALQISKIVKRVTNQLIKKGGKSHIKFADKNRESAEALYKSIWMQTWSVSSIIKSCPPSSVCTVNDLTATTNSLSEMASELQRLVQISVKRLRKATKNKTAGKTFLNKAARIYNTSLLELQAFPQSSSICPLQ